MEENRSFSWSNLFIKVIIVIIFVLFTIWLLSLSNRSVTNSLDVLTNNIFSENMEKMKEVGKDYFTTERLPKKIGQVETLTLEDMYEKKLILELTDKYGNACSAKNSYVSVEKYDDEYQMKVYLECGKHNDYIIVVMGCYDYCDSDICEKTETKEEVKKLEYQYKKVTGGNWTDYGAWSDWSKVSVTNNDYRQIETKVSKEDYTYDKTTVEVDYKEYEAVCPEGYTKNSNGTKCVKEIRTEETTLPVCPTVSGYKNTGIDGFTCNYSKTITTNTIATAECKDGYNASGNSCSKTITVTTTKTASCPTGYKKSGNTCVEEKADTKNPVCPTVSGYTKTSQNGFTCNYSKTTNEVDYVYEDSDSAYDLFPTDTDKYHYVKTSTTTKYACVEGNSACGIHTYYTYDIYRKEYKTTTETTTKTASCPTGYKKSGNTCVEEKLDTKNPVCPVVSGYTKTSQNGFTCNYSKATNDIKDPVCPVVSGYKNTGLNGFTCSYSKTITTNDTKEAVCPTGYNKTLNGCVKVNVSNEEADMLKVCPTGYTDNGTKCSKEIQKTETVTEYRDVTYYRYRIREYVGGSVDYKWSSSKEDKTLLNSGYVLTGKTR